LVVPGSDCLNIRQVGYLPAWIGDVPPRVTPHHNDRRPSLRNSQRSRKISASDRASGFTCSRLAAGTTWVLP